MSLPISTSNNPQEQTGVIYRIYHKESMKSYIGQTVHPEKRIQKHFNGYDTSPALHNAIKKYGKDAFAVEILECDVPEPQLSKMEILHIRFFNSKRPHGYNLTDGGGGVRGIEAWNKGKTGVYSDETLKKLSEAQKGKTLSLETRRKISAAQTGKKHSPETRRTIGEANKGRRHGAETRRKMSVKKRPEYPSARAYYFLAIPPDATLREKRKQLREQFPEIHRRTINNWVRRWESELSCAD